MARPLKFCHREGGAVAIGGHASGRRRAAAGEGLHLLLRWPMRVINRTAITLVGDQPYLEWTRQKEADVNRGTLTVARAKTYGSAFLLPEFELEEDVQEWVEENATWLFERQPAAWPDD